jgi:hypothetical protein
MNLRRSSIGLHSCQGILLPPQKAQLCNPCPRNELSPISQEGQRRKQDGSPILTQAHARICRRVQGAFSRSAGAERVGGNTISPAQSKRVFGRRLIAGHRSLRERQSRAEQLEASDLRHNGFNRRGNKTLGGSVKSPPVGAEVNLCAGLAFRTTGTKSRSSLCSSGRR